MAGEWFLFSGIRLPGGGVARYFRHDLGRNLPVSTEITGYSVSALSFLYQRFGDPRYLEAAVESAQFLTRRAWEPKQHVMPFEIEPAEHTYFFDTGIIARGLLTLWRITSDQEWRDAAERCARSMLQDFDAGSDFHPILRLPAKEPLAREPRWSRSSGSYQLKAALAWREIAEDGGAPAFAEAFERILQFALRSSGSFFLPEHGPEERMDRLHAWAYYLEGLVAVSTRPQCAEALAAGIERASELMREIEPRFLRADACAQLLRARIYAAHAGACTLDERAASQEASWLAEMQRAAAALHYPGGFVFGRKGGTPVPHVSPVPAAFALQALDMWEQWQNGHAPDSWHWLI